MKMRRLIVMILTVCMIVTYMPITGYAYADETDNDQETGSETIGSSYIVVPSDNETEEKASIRTLSGEAQSEALEEYLEKETASDDIIEEESGIDYNTYDLGENVRAKVFFSYPIRFENESGELAYIEPELTQTDDKNIGYPYESKAGPYKTYIPSSLNEDTPILMENDKYTFTMSPSEEILDETGSRASVDDVTASFGTDSDDIKLEYISQNDGVKENIVLNERPSSNELSFILTFSGMTYREDPTDKGITFYDPETDDIVMGLASPFMNDSTGEAYSEDIEVKVEEIRGEETETTILRYTLKVSDKYLDDPERVYPVIIDPTATWVDNSQVRDSYVLSNNPNTNYYSTSNTTMLSGTNSSGTRRTYIHILNLKSQLIGANITSSSFDVYETGAGRSGYGVRMYRITEDWTNSTVTWNNKPDISTSYASERTSTGTANNKLSFDVTTWTRRVVSEEINNVEYILKEYTYTDWGAVETVKDYYDFKTSGTSKYILLNYGYDRLTNLSEMVYTKEDDTVIESHYYSYDKAGKIITEENYSSLNDLNEIRRFEYDTLGRLILSDIKDIVEESGDTTEENKIITEYSYDKVGNRLTKTENGEETAYVYNGLNQLLTEMKGTDTLTYSYDSNGNQTGVTGTSDGETVSKTMTYTPGGMMETYSDGERVEQNTYIRGETRIRKAEGTSLQNLTDITNYFYQEGSVLYTTGEENETKSFNLLNVSDIFATEREGANSDEYYFYLNDVRGSKTMLIDNTAGGIVSYWYNDFGEVSEERNEAYEDFVNEVQYTGAIYDGSTGLLYLNARFYDPATGRFTSQDSYRGERDKPGTWHLYAYCANDPVNRIDPDGHEWKAMGISLQIALSTGTIVHTPAFGIDFVWFFSNLKERYKNRSFHLYLTKGSAFTNSMKDALIRKAKSNPWNLLSKDGLKKIKGSFRKSVSISGQIVGITGNDSVFKKYGNYSGVSSFITLGMLGKFATVSTSGYIACVGAGYTTSKEPFVCYGYTYSYFISDKLDGAIEKIKSNVSNRARYSYGSKKGHKR